MRQTRSNLIMLNPNCKTPVPNVMYKFQLKLSRLDLQNLFNEHMIIQIYTKSNLSDE